MFWGILVAFGVVALMVVLLVMLVGEILKGIVAALFATTTRCTACSSRCAGCFRSEPCRFQSPVTRCGLKRLGFWIRRTLYRQRILVLVR
jgi:hypothetical protein